MSAATHREWTELRTRAASSRASGTVVVVAIVVAALYFGRTILIPVALAVLLSFVLAPLVLLLRRARAGRVPSVLIAVLLTVLAILGVGALIGGQVVQLADNLPGYETTITRKMQALHETDGGVIGRASSVLADLGKEITRTTEKARETAASSASPRDGEPEKPITVEIRQPPAAPLEVISDIVGPLSVPLGTIGIVIVFLLFILLQREDLRDRFIRLVGARDLHRTTHALDDGATRLSRFLLVQSAINAGYGATIGVGLFFIDVPNPVLWAVLTMLLRFLPYVGWWIAALFPAALAIATDPGWSTLLWTLLLFGAVELITGQIIEPLLNAHSTGLSPVAVAVAAAFWTWLWGPVGLLLSTPLTVCLVVLGRHAGHLRFLDVLLGNEPALTPEESFYQRMLAGDPDEVTRHAEEFLKDKPLWAYYDEIAMKALALAQSDVRRGVLDREQSLAVKETIEGLIDNLSEHGNVDPSSPAGHKPAVQPVSPLAVSVLCIGARGALDEAAAAMLVQVLLRRGIGARVVSSQGLTRRRHQPPWECRCGDGLRLLSRAT